MIGHARTIPPVFSLIPLWQASCCWCQAQQQRSWVRGALTARQTISMAPALVFSFLAQMEPGIMNFPMMNGGCFCPYMFVSMCVCVCVSEWVSVSLCLSVMDSALLGEKKYNPANQKPIYYFSQKLFINTTQRDRNWDSNLALGTHYWQSASCSSQVPWWFCYTVWIPAAHVTTLDVVVRITLLPGCTKEDVWTSQKYPEIFLMKHWWWH